MENSSKHKSGNTKKLKISRNVHIIIEILIFTALVGITALLLQPLRMSILHQMTDMRDYLIGEAETFLGRKIEYASMGPSVFATLDIRDIRILNDDGKAILTIGRFRLSYSLLALIRGEKQNSLRSIRIDMPVMNLDTERDADILSLFSSSSKSQQGDSASLENEADADDGKIQRQWQGIDFLPDKIQVRLRSGKGTLTVGDNDFSVEGLSFDGNIRNRRVIFTGRWKVETAISGLFDQKIRAVMAGGISGDFATSLTNGNLNLSIPTLSGDLFTFKSLTVNLAVSPEIIELRKIKDRSPYDLFVKYEIDTGTLNAEFYADNFSPRDILSFSGPWKPYNEWLYVQTSGYASFQRTSDKNFQYDINLSGKTPPRLPVKDASFEIKSKGDSNRADFFPVRFDLPQGSVLFNGNMQFKTKAVNGNLVVKDLTLTGENPLSADFSINTYGNETSIFSENISIGSLILSAFDSYIINQQDSLSFSVTALRFRDIESYDNVSLSRVALDGSYDFTPRHLQASFSLDSFSTDDMMEAVRPFVKIPFLPDVAKNQLDRILVTTELFITTDFEHISYNAPRFIAAYNKGGQDVLTLFSVSGTDKRFELSNGSILAEGSLDFSGDADFSNVNDISFSFRAVYKDFTYFIDGMFIDQRSLNINGSYGFNLYLAMTDQGSYSGSVFVDSVPIPFKNRTAKFSISSFIRWTDPNFWSVDVERLELADLPMPGNTPGRFLLQGIADDAGATFPNIFFDDGKGVLTGTVKADWSNKFSTAKGTIVLNDRTGSEQYLLEGNYADRVFDLSITGTRMQLSRFIENTSNMVASADVALNWSSAEAFSLGVNLLSLTGTIGKNEINAYAHVDIDQDTASIHNTRMLLGGVVLDLPSLEMNRLKSDLYGSLNVSGTILGRDMDIGLLANANYKPIDSWFDFAEAAGSFQGSLNVYKIRVNTAQVTEPFQFHVARDDSMLTLTGGPKEMIRFNISDKGDFYAGLSNPSPLRGSIIGNISQGQIDAQASKLYVDLAALWKIMPDRVKEIIDLPGGFVDVSVHVKGPLADPEFFGTARGTSVRLKLPQYLTADIGPTPIDVKLEGNEMTFGPLTTQVGKGKGQVSGYFLFDRWIPDTFALNILVPKESPVPYGFDQGGVKASGNASGRLTVDLEDRVFRIQGDLTAYNTILTVGDSARGNSDSSSGSYKRLPAVVDMKITTGPRVEFVFPNESYPIVSAYADLGSSIHITADSEIGAFSVVGDVALRGGDIYYINRSFYIREGVVKLNENESKFDPLITARADINEVSQDGRVTISLVLDNAPLMSFVPRFESNPPLSQLEIMTLLGQNPATGSSNPLLTISGDFLSQFKVIQDLERSLRNFLRLDMFSIRTAALQNALFLVTGLQQPVSSFGNLGNYFDNTTVFIGKHLTQDMFLQSMFSLRYDDMVDAWGGLKLEADIGLELSSPLVNIKWNFVPLHPENMFIDDLSFTLSWKWSF